MFVRTETGYFSEHQIEIITKKDTNIYGRKTQRWAAIVNGQAHWIDDDDLPQGTIIPAIPGFDLLVCYKDNDQIGVLEFPIVAWKVVGGVAEPVTVEPNDNQWYGIRPPNGKIKVPYEEFFDSIEDFIAEFERRLRRDEKARLKSSEQSL